MFFISFFCIISFSNSPNDELNKEEAVHDGDILPEKYDDKSELEFGNFSDFDRGIPLDDDDYDMQRYDDNGNPICGDNAKYIDNHCVCDEGFFYGDPRSELGCYNCADNCSQYAQCIYPGHCECNALYTGNGTFCKFNTPSILSVHEVEDNLLLVNIYFPSDTQITMAFCKFGDIVVQGKNLSNKRMFCEIPKNIPEHCVFKISENTEDWSSDSIIYESKVRDQAPGKKNTGLIIVFALSMVVVSILMFNTKAPQKIESQPFIKEKPKPGEENIKDNSYFDNPPQLPPLGPDDIDDNNNMIIPPFEQSIETNNQTFQQNLQNNQQLPV